jgi:hypothetical protein
VRSKPAVNAVRTSKVCTTEGASESPGFAEEQPMSINDGRSDDEQQA